MVNSVPPMWFHPLNYRFPEPHDPFTARAPPAGDERVAVGGGEEGVPRVVEEGGTTQPDPPTLTQPDPPSLTQPDPA